MIVNSLSSLEKYGNFGVFGGINRDCTRGLLATKDWVYVYLMRNGKGMLPRAELAGPLCSLFFLLRMERLPICPSVHDASHLSVNIKR